TSDLRMVLPFLCSPALGPRAEGAGISPAPIRLGASEPQSARGDGAEHREALLGLRVWTSVDHDLTADEVAVAVERIEELDVAGVTGQNAAVGGLDQFGQSYVRVELGESAALCGGDELCGERPREVHDDRV